MQNKAFIFDLDGTLVNTLASLQLSGNEMLAHYGLPGQDLESYRLKVGDGSRKLVIRLLGEKTNSLPLDEALNLYLERYAANCLKQIAAYEDMPETLHLLKAHGYKLGVLTNKPHPMSVKVLEQVYGQDFFDFILGQKSGAKPKPDPHLLPGLIATHNLQTAKSFFVGDSPVDIYTAATASMPSVGVLWGYRSAEELQAAGARCLLSEASQLLELI